MRTEAAFADMGLTARVNVKNPMRTSLVFAAILFGATCATAAPPVLQRGVGLHEWLNWPPLAEDGSYRWPPYRSVADWQARYRPLTDWPEGDPFVAMRELGFDFVRLSVDPGPLVASDGERRSEALAVLSEAVNRLRAADLTVVFDLHSVMQVPRYGRDVINAPASSDEIADYIAMTADVARMLLEHGTERIVFEPYNEPAHYPCDAGGTGDWQRIMERTMAAIRDVSTELTVMATGACGGGVDGLLDLDPGFDDPNVLYSFHMYEPLSFTHQRGPTEEGFGSGLPWPASGGSPEAVAATLEVQMEVAGIDPATRAANLAEQQPVIAEYFAEGWGPAQLQSRMDDVLAWADGHGIGHERLFMGEFGVIRMSRDGRTGAFDADRLRYLEAVRVEAETRGIAWSVWEYSNPHGMSVIEPVGPTVPDAALLRALGL